LYGQSILSFALNNLIHRDSGQSFFVERQQAGPENLTQPVVFAVRLLSGYSADIPTMTTRDILRGCSTIHEVARNRIFA
jgi:hypothetical protein